MSNWSACSRDKLALTAKGATAMGAGIAASPAVNGIAAGRLWAIVQSRFAVPSRPVIAGGFQTGMLARKLVRADAHRLATLLLSGPVRRSAPVRGPLLSAWRFRDRHDALPGLTFCLQCVKHRFPAASPGRRQSDRQAARHSLHLRFARPVPRNAQGVFSDAAAGITASSIGLVFPFISVVSC